MTKRRKSFHWFGGKARPELQDFILKLLPLSYEAYVEPFAGALGILINRPKARMEIANDLNRRIVNWWEVARNADDVQELQRLLMWTPHSEEVYYRCAATIDEGTPIERAWKFQVMTTYSRMHSDDPKKSHFSWRIANSHPPVLQWESLTDLRDRIKDVTLRNIPAVDLLDRIKDEEHAVTYCDPPYSTADTSVYRVVQHDRERMLELLRVQKGAVAISGYNDEWDELGWVRHEFKTIFTHGIKGAKAADRTEVLWTNYSPPQGRLL